MNLPTHRYERPSGFAEAVHEEPETDLGTRLRNGWLMVLERKWYALAVFLVVVLSAATYTFLATPIYEAVATIQVLKQGPQVLRVADVVESSVTSDTDFYTQIKILESLTLLQNVASRLTADEVRQLTEPYRKGSSDAASPVAVIFRNRKIVPQRLSLITAVQFRHPNPKIAARIANLIASEYIAYNSRVRVEESLKAVDELKDRADQQRKRVDEIANALHAFRQRGNLISLVQSKDIVTEKLKALNLMATETGAKLNEAEVRWNQVQEWTRSGRDLAELPFIAIQVKVAQLVQQVTTQKLAVAQLRQRYKDKHPKLIEAVNTLAQAEAELKAAIETASASIKSEYENARQTNEEAHKALAEQEARSLDVDKNAVEYENLEREFRVNEQLLEAMITRMRETSVTSSIDAESARIVDRAFEPAQPVSPRIFLTMAFGIVAGAVLAFGFAYLIALVDDRIKTAFDVESLLGLPLIGVIPRVSRMDQPDKAQIVSNGADRMIVEAFHSLYSSLHIKEESKNARVLLVTSTLSGEGKSFVATNLAQAFASQGRRTVVVDCDLRKPNVHRSFRLRPGKGVIDYCLRGLGLADIVATNVCPNLDVVASGGRATNPIQLFSSKEFEVLIAELSHIYDRVVLDTPPLGAVSDAINILPFADGSIYVIQYNRVTRRGAQRCIHRFASAGTPVFGAVLNDMRMGITSDYYVANHSRVFREYYEVKAEET